MALAVQEQCHRYLVENEKRRCVADEAKRRAAHGKKAKPVKPKTIPVPTVRPGPRALCQETEYLYMVTELDYDLGNPEFVAYCGARGVLVNTATPGSHRWIYFQDTTKSWRDFSKDRRLRFAEKVGPQKAHEFSEDELKLQWRVVTLGRAKLQDCWELFQNETATVDLPR